MPSTPSHSTILDVAPLCGVSLSCVAAARLSAAATIERRLRRAIHSVWKRLPPRRQAHLPPWSYRLDATLPNEDGTTFAQCRVPSGLLLFARKQITTFPDWAL